MNPFRNLFVCALVVASSCKEPSAPPAPPHEPHAEEHGDEVHLSAEAIVEHRVTVAKIAPRVVPPTLRVPGRVTWDEDRVARLGAPLRGRVLSAVGLGAAVAAGDVLCTLHCPEYAALQNEYVQKERALALARRAVEVAGNSLERARKLQAAEQGIPVAELEKRAAEVHTAEANVQSLASALDVVGRNLRSLGMQETALAGLATAKSLDAELAIRAPFAGQVVARAVGIGQSVGPEGPALLTLADPGATWTLADVPERAVSRVRVGARAFVRTDGDVTPLEGKVTFVAPALDLRSRSVAARVVTAPAPERLRPGRFVEVDLEVDGDVAPALLVPETAVFTWEGKPVVFVPVPGEENTFAPRGVVLGPPRGELVPVVSGLEEGASVVVTGGFILKAELGKGHAHHDH